MSSYQLLRPTSSDFDFLKNVHHVTLRPHVEKIWGWEDKVQDEFFKEDFESGEIQIIQVGAQSIGYLQINEKDDALHIVNILILPEFQNRKLGTAIINDLVDKSLRAKRAVKLGVFKVNTRAKDLYSSLGFNFYAETETHFLMEIAPEKEH